MVDISIILPSLRIDQANSFIDWVNMQKAPCRYEIVLASPFKILKPNVVWLEDKGQHNGSILPINNAIPFTKGEFISVASDDAPYDFGWWSIMDFIQKMDKGRKFRIAGFTKTHLRFFQRIYKNPKFVWLPFLRKFHPEAQTHGIHFAGWFCLQRNTLALLGGKIFRPEFKAFYADNDLGMRLHQQGEPFKFCPTARIICSGNVMDQTHKSNVSRHLDGDRDVFNSFWAKQYGLV